MIESVKRQSRKAHVSVEWGSRREVQPERAERQDLHAHPHYAGLVQTRLPVQGHDVAVHQVALHLVAHLQVLRGLL